MASPVKIKEATFVIIGGGIAGVSCAQVLNMLAPEEKTIMISASPTIKAVTNVVPLTRTLAEFDVEERGAETLCEECPAVEVLQEAALKVEPAAHTVLTDKGTAVHYKKLCVCSGARPRLIAEGNPRVIGIRDTDSAQDLRRRLGSSRRVAIVGNGGIATELVHELRGVEVVWVVKDKHIAAPYIDAGAAHFFRSRLSGEGAKGDAGPAVRRHSVRGGKGAALGPHWHEGLELVGPLGDLHRVTVEYSAEVVSVGDRGPGDWPVFLELTNGKVWGADLVVSATGVLPDARLLEGVVRLAPDGGIEVDDKMESSAQDVFAAGDVCTAGWEHARHWLQMRLWTQARLTGAYAASAMHASLTAAPLLQDFGFEMFTHVTKFFGTKVVLLGLFNGQKLGGDYDLQVRVTEGVEYVKLVLKEGRLQGAVLIGDTDLEEMCENLILNQLDLSPFGEHLLDPIIDIEDYFD